MHCVLNVAIRKYSTSDTTAICVDVWREKKEKEKDYIRQDEGERDARPEKREKKFFVDCSLKFEFMDEKRKEEEKR